MRHCGENRAKTTEFTDVETEYEILGMYKEYLIANADAAFEEHNLETKTWSGRLLAEVLVDLDELEVQYERLTAILGEGMMVNISRNLQRSRHKQQHLPSTRSRSL